MALEGPVDLLDQGLLWSHLCQEDLECHQFHSVEIIIIMIMIIIIIIIQ